ncbi:transcriptional regulator [Candidatus Phycosocius spiralis]|uniref:Transcriptional regulator n=2 Tax=Candidatus Phycosocius spiralis TaxID=2815099 RepID=A0ABQ4PWT9_9PROT|nr:transcriptional regulator [Candidatus Phycosocius spiralis]
MTQGAVLRPVRTKADYEQALARIDALWAASYGTPEGDELEALAILVQAYEAQVWPTLPLDPIEALIAHMDLNGYQQSDLAAILGSPSRASETLNRKRALSLSMIRTISAKWGIPVSFLVKAYPLAA